MLSEASTLTGCPGGPPYLDVIVHGGVRGQFLRLLCHVRPGATERTHACVAAAESCLPPGCGAEESSGGANEGGPPLKSHDPAHPTETQRRDRRTDTEIYGEVSLRLDVPVFLGTVNKFLFS